LYIAHQARLPSKRRHAQLRVSVRRFRKLTFRSGLGA
jgi:hypothetical protein